MNPKIKTKISAKICDIWHFRYQTDSFCVHSYRLLFPRKYYFYRTLLDKVLNWAKKPWTVSSNEVNLMSISYKSKRKGNIKCTTVAHSHFTQKMFIPLIKCNFIKKRFSIFEQRYVNFNFTTWNNNENNNRQPSRNICAIQ